MHDGDPGDLVVVKFGIAMRENVTKADDVACVRDRLSAAAGAKCVTP
jgi:hypothetical protein